MIQKIDKSPSVSKYDSNLLELSNLLSDKKGQNTLQPIDIFFYIQYIVNRIDDFFFDILLDINPITKDNKKYCHTLLDRLFITTKECCSLADKTLYDISILYCDLYKRYYEMLFNDCFDLHQDYYNQLKTDINEACSINNYYVFFYKLRRYIVELVINITNNTISQDEICNKIHEMSSLHFSYNAWTSFDIHFFTTMVFHILFEAKKTHPNSTEIEELYDCFFLAYLKHINDNQEIFRYQNNKDILMTQFYLDQQ